MPLGIDLSDVSIDETPIGRINAEPDPEVVKLLQANIGKGLRLPRMSQEQWEKSVRPEFTKAAGKLNLLPLNWRDTQGRWYTVPRTQDQKQHREPLTPEQQKARTEKALATKARNKAEKEKADAAAEAAQKAQSQQRPQVVPSVRARAS